jgi:hypothetical protein
MFSKQYVKLANQPKHVACFILSYMLCLMLKKCICVLKTAGVCHLKIIK